MTRRRGSKRRPEPSPESQPETVTAPLAETDFHDPKELNEPQSPERRRPCKRIAGVRKSPRMKKRLRSEKTRRSEAHESEDPEQSSRDQHMSAPTFREGSNTRETESVHGGAYMHDPSRIPLSTALDDSRVVRNVGTTDTAGDPRHSTDREMRAKSGRSYHRASPPASSRPPGTSHPPLQRDNRIVSSINIDEEPHRNQEITRRRSEPSPLSSRDNITSERHSLPRKAVSRLPQKMSEASSVASRGQLNEPVVISRTRKSSDEEIIAMRDPDYDRQMHMRAHPNQQNLPVSASRPPSNSNDGESASKEKSNENLVLMGKLAFAQRKELDMEETISDQEKLIRQLRLEKSGLFLTITEKNKTISRLERELAALNEAFDMQAHKSSRRSKAPGKGKIPDELQPYMSIVLAMEKELSTNAELETKELELARSDGVRIRCWLGRADTVQVGFGLLPGKRHSEEEIMPMCPIDLAERNGFYTPSGPSHEILYDLAKEVLNRPHYRPLYRGEDRKTCTKTISRSPYMLGKFRRFTNDRVSNRKRLLKDKFVELLGYNLISVRNIEKLSPSEKERRLEQVKELQSKLLAKEDPSSWRMLPFNQLKFSGADLPPEPAEPEYAPDVLFQNSIGPQLVRSLFGFNPNHCPGTLDSSTLYLARLDAWIYTSVKLLNHQARKGGETQKIFQETFASVVVKAVLSLIREIRTVVSCNLQEELVRKETDNGRADDSSQERSWRFATSVRKMPRKNMYYLNVHPLWFHDNITSRLGNVRDAYIGWCNIEDSFFQEFIQEGEPLQQGSGDSFQIPRTTE